MSEREHEPKQTRAFSRSESGSAQITLPLSALVTLAPVLVALGVGGGVAARHGESESVTEAVSKVGQDVVKVDRKVDIIMTRLDQFEPRLTVVEAEARRNSDRITRLEEREAAAAARPQPPR